MSKFTKELNRRFQGHQGDEGPGGVFTHPSTGGGHKTPSTPRRQPTDATAPVDDLASGCQAIKRSGGRCPNEAGADGLCRWHRMNDAKATKANPTDTQTPAPRSSGLGPFGRCWYCGNPPTSGQPWGQLYGIWGHYDDETGEFLCPPLRDGWKRCEACSYARPPGKWEFGVDGIEEYLVAVAEHGGGPLGEPEAWCLDAQACHRRACFEMGQ